MVGPDGEEKETKIKEITRLPTRGDDSTRTENMKFFYSSIRYGEFKNRMSYPLQTGIELMSINTLSTPTHYQTILRPYSWR